ncbi:hypothetical protein RFN28_00800 [Mesorhizobium sp. VK24D]|uniref:Diadenosine tetraphosphate hydrolase n=1 Tax=Mesorhizobium album TaxID=3072314 RepID=A0ABU4XTT8_9HYPH|nr:hypothetical protein [Mesorhizobium sp. VK24D]MDX8477009.1 hypothetical protein [Mesorhizobium sp. VK24D]
MAVEQIDASWRFSNVLSRNSRMVWDTVVYEDDDVIVIPTLGALVADWLLIVPKANALNFSSWSNKTGRNPIFLAEAVKRRIAPGSSPIWFEHGPSQEGSEVGCGVDYAHIHLLLQPPADLKTFHQTVSDLSQVEWQEADVSSVYPQPIADRHYYAFGDFNSARVHAGGTLGRQFFRKAIAQLVGRPREWDYREFDGMKNVRQTIDHFSKSIQKAA